MVVLFTLIHWSFWEKKGSRAAPAPLLNGILASLQCKRLEQELHHMKEQNQTSANNPRHLTAENNQERALKVNLHSFLQANEGCQPRVQLSLRHISVVYISAEVSRAVCQQPLL